MRKWLMSCHKEIYKTMKANDKSSRSKYVYTKKQTKERQIKQTKIKWYYRGNWMSFKIDEQTGEISKMPYVINNPIIT